MLFCNSHHFVSSGSGNFVVSYLVHLGSGSHITMGVAISAMPLMFEHIVYFLPLNGLIMVQLVHCIDILFLVVHTPCLCKLCGECKRLLCKCLWIGKAKLDSSPLIILTLSLINETLCTRIIGSLSHFATTVRFYILKY